MFCFMYVLCTASQRAQAAISSHITAEVERPALAIMLMRALLRVAQSKATQP